MGKSIQTTKLFLAFILINYLPGVFFVVLNASSMAQGLLAGSISATLLLFKYRYIQHIKKRALIRTLFFLFIGIAYVGVMFAATSNPKVLTILFLVPLLFSAYIFSESIIHTDSTVFITAIRIFTYLTLILGWLAVFDISNIGVYADYPKSVAPFSEESHYALCAGLFSIIYSAFKKQKDRYFLIANVGLQAVFLPNLTLLVFFALSLGLLAINLRRMTRVLVVLPAALILSTTVFSYLYEVDYFASRLAFQDTQNLTTLVWIQGWELARLNFHMNLGTGLGLQMLGSYATDIPPVSYEIQRMHAENRMLNLEDAGFLSAKIVAELGIFGIFVVFMYAITFIRSYLLLPRYSRTFARPYHAQVFSNAIIYGFFVEFFLRGYGYFSSGVFLFFSAIIISQKVMTDECISINSINTQK